MKFKKIASLVLVLSLAGFASAEPYEKQPNRGVPDKVMSEAFTNTATFLQYCTIGGVISCQTPTSLGVRYTSSSAYNELSNTYGCTYKTSTSARASSPGYDLYYCGANSGLPGYTMLVLLEGDYATSFAGTVSALYQP
jgi:hypothetical protein